MAGKGKRGKGKNNPTHSKQGKEQKLSIGDEKPDGNVENEAKEQKRESEENVALSKEVKNLLEGMNITSSTSLEHAEMSSGAKIPYCCLSGHQSVCLKGFMEGTIAKYQDNNPECGHTDLDSEIGDCDLCWVIAAMDALCLTVKIRGGNYELIKRNCDLLLNCYDDENYPYILRKAFKYVKEHNISKDVFYPSETECHTPRHEVPEEVKSLRLKGFRMIDHKDEEALVLAVRNGPIIGGVRQSPEFTMLGNKIYRGSNNEITIGGRFCNHGLVVTGFKGIKNKGTRYWMVKNSAGKRWGDEGYGKVARNSSLPTNIRDLLTSTMRPIFE